MQGKENKFTSSIIRKLILIVFVENGQYFKIPFNSNFQKNGCPSLKAWHAYRV